MLLTESFSYKIGTIKTKNGFNMRVAYIDSKMSQNTFDVKEKIKKYGAAWNNVNKWWYWPLGNNPEDVIRNKVRPCMEELAKVEVTDNGTKRNIEASIDELIAKVKDASMPSSPNALSKDKILDKLEQYKLELVNCVSSEEFKRKLEPIIKFRNASGHIYSLLNSLLILIQDPEATMVKSKGHWYDVNRVIVPNAKAIYLWRPNGKRQYTKEEQEEVTRRFLRRARVDRVEKLTPGQREVLKVKLNKVVPISFELEPNWFDYRFTKQIPNKEDLVGNPSADIPWYENDGKETPYLASKFDALLEVINEYGVQLEFVDDLGGARGVSRNGKISLLANQPKDVGMLNTGIHEFAHELLHQKYVHSKNPEMKEYFVGTEEGRAKVEQQAELCAWIVMRSFGFNLTTNMNYVGIWGLNEENAVSVFNSVSKTATFITDEILKNEKGGNMNESKKLFKENNIPSGFEIAKMVGCGDVYKKAALKRQKKQQVIPITESQLKNIVNDIVNKILK